MTDPLKTSKKIKPALLLIDVQNYYLRIVPQRDKDLAIYFINILIDLFRENGFPIVRIYHNNEENGPRPNSVDFEYPPQILVNNEDIQIIKTYSDGFNKTRLNSVLRENGINTLFLCGLSAVGCVLATRTGGMNNDYKTFIVKDAIMSHSTEFTRNVESMFDAISFEAVKLIVESAEK